jgi:SulP family sulfate permease
MAATIADAVGEDKPEAVIATTITSYALSAILTGAVFYLMGRFRFGYLVGFIPRHILIGCIGGVGLFLVATGFEVTARLEGSFNYDLDTLHRLTRADTLALWIIPLALAVILFTAQSRITSKYFLPLYILAIPAVFYASTAAFNLLDPQKLRDGGWVFEGPPAGEPWWYFYTLYSMDPVPPPIRSQLTTLQSSSWSSGGLLYSASRQCLLSPSSASCTFPSTCQRWL